VVRITETTEAPDIVRLLEEYRIKRVPVVRDDRIVGIVSRADLLRAFTAEHSAQHGSGHISARPGVVGEIIRAIDARFGHKNAAVAAGAPRETLPTAAEAGLTVTDFRALTADFAHHNVEHQEEARQSAAGQRHNRVRELIDHHALPFWHYTCTAKMGRDDMSVVDGNLRVYGIDGLRIADGSIMPNVTTGNTMAPCVIIGERAAEIIRKDRAV
jgi:choline dehydrogenase-like flavoprotein